MKQDKKAVKIGIVGAGPAGLTTALALEAYAPNVDFDIILFDKNETPYDYPGVEYGIQERACRALERIGIKERALHRGVRAHTIEFYNSRLNRRFQPINSNPEYTRCVVRQEFLSDLSDLISTTTVKMQHKVVDIAALADGSVQVETIDHVNKRDQFIFDIFIACDGSFSTARRLFYPESAEKIDQGFSCMYMLVEPKNPLDASERFLNLSNGGTSQLIMGTKSTLTLFPLGKNRLAYGIGFDHHTKQALWAQNNLQNDEKWAEIPAFTKRNIAASLVEDACPHDSTYLEALDHVDDWDSYKIYLWQMKDTDPLLNPSPENCNLLLIGDAAHAILPTIGMGASLAIEDAELVGKQIANALEKYPNPDDIRTHFKEIIAKPYAKSRVPIWKDLVGRARLAARENFIDQANKKRFAIGPAIPNSQLSKVVSGVESVMRKLTWY